MASPQTVWGLDVGRCALKAIKLRLADDKAEIVGVDYVEHAKILTQPDADRSESIRAALEKFLSRNDISKDHVVVSVPGQHTLARFTKLPPVAAKRIPDLVRFEADQQIPFDMDEVIWDYQTFQQAGTPDLEVGIFAMKRELLREHLLHFEQSAIEPIGVQTSPLAVYNAAHYDGWIGDNTTIILDIGAENTDLIIATVESFWTRTVPIGGNHFTEALVKAFKLSFAKAENLKRTAETSKYVRQIYQAMGPIFADLVQELQRSIGFYSSTHRDARIEKVVCVGNGFKLSGLKKYLQQNLGLSVSVPSSFNKAAVSAEANAKELRDNFSSFAVAYGLAVQGGDAAKINSNLLPTEIAKQVVWRKKRSWFGAAAACLLISGGLIWFRYTSDMSALAAGSQDTPPKFNDPQSAWDAIDLDRFGNLSDRARAAGILNAGQALKTALAALSGAGEAERSETEAIVKLQRQRIIVPRILHAIHEALPVLSGPLGQAKTPEQIVQAIENGAPARGERKQVFIDSLFMHFEPNVNAYEWRSLVPAPEPINDPEADLPAMKIEIKCRTPNKGGQQFISNGFMEDLRRAGRKSNQGFYFDRVYLIDGKKVEIEGGSTRSGTRGGFGSRGRGFGGTSAPAVATTAPPATFDPVTGESIVEDWQFDIWVDAILEDYPGDGDEKSEADDEE
jgi:type IV pilus assembly protein PilM